MSRPYSNKVFRKDVVFILNYFAVKGLAREHLFEYITEVLNPDIRFPDETTWTIPDVIKAFWAIDECEFANGN